MWSRARALVLGTALLVTAAAHPPRAYAAGRFFPETGYVVDDPSFLDFYDRRGGLRSFGYPVSREFTFLGFPSQIFQRAIMQRFPDGHVALLNLLDSGLFPYTEVNGAVFPGVDPRLMASAPRVGSPGDGRSVLDWISATTPNRWQGMPVAFRRSFFSTVAASNAFPTGGGDPSLLPGFDLEVWGLPTSQPTFDPRNARFVYQRFQRGILHYDESSGATQGILLADYFKAILIGNHLPPDLAKQARGSPFFAQYNPRKPRWVDRPEQLPNTDLSHAFEPETLVVLDPGHGGHEVGASHVFPDGVTLREKDLTLDLANRTAALLRNAGYAVLQTRQTDSWVDVDLRDTNGDGVVNLFDDLQARVDAANEARAPLFLSIHFNGNDDPSLSGTTVYYDDGRPFSPRGRYFASLVDREVVAALRESGYPDVDRGVAVDTQATGGRRHFYVLGPNAARPTQMPGALVESLFLTNSEDARELRDPHTLDAVAHGLARAVEEYFAGAR